MVRRLLALCLLAAAAQAGAADPDPFPPLERSSTAELRYPLGTESELAAYAGWSDLEARSLRLATLTRGAFSGAAGLKIHYRLYRHRAETRGTVVLVAGRTEGLVMYQELILDLLRNGYSVHIQDHRGQGFSQRLLPEKPSLGHVDQFQHYVDDLAAFIDGPSKAARSRRPLFLLAHSMGGAVSALYLEQQAANSGVAAAALVTPMMEPWADGEADAGLAARLAGGYCARFSVDVGPLGRLSEQYAEGSDFDSEYAKVREAAADAPNALTHSARRFARHWQARDEARCTGEDCGWPDAKIGGPSLRWFNQACVGSEQARGPAAAGIRVPVLLLQGGLDRVVKPEAQQSFCAQLNSGSGTGYCVGRRLPGALHSIFIEADAQRQPALRRVLGFFDCVRGENEAPRPASTPVGPPRGRQCSRH
ncbi:alpha/beta fold hydrolase [Roseateles violae]|uniref:Alpha/beta fold hydrolase n=1 Tax=Roseateles violae TaxID=3058042 RepID=A0ABT8DSI7_9BURK|nr:alpha/beta fold hydrolase [Pelomonas sp. PFR6]MDN3919995.1 alpha/beta fold hydrolase [Pelomonas sp. PFR6]